MRVPSLLVPLLPLAPLVPPVPLVCPGTLGIRSTPRTCSRVLSEVGPQSDPVAHRAPTATRRPSFWSNLCVVFTKWDWNKRLGGFNLRKLGLRRAEWRDWFKVCEAEYSGSGQSVESAMIQFFAVDLPSITLAMDEEGLTLAEVMEETLRDCRGSTSDPVRSMVGAVHGRAGAAPTSMLVGIP